MHDTYVGGNEWEKWGRHVSFRSVVVRENLYSRMSISNYTFRVLNYSIVEYSWKPHYNVDGLVCFVFQSNTWKCRAKLCWHLIYMTDSVEWHPLLTNVAIIDKQSVTLVLTYSRSLKCRLKQSVCIVWVWISHEFV